MYISCSANRFENQVLNAEQLRGKIPRHDFGEVIEDEFKLYDWLHSLHSIGTALVTNTPPQVDEGYKLCYRVRYRKFWAEKDCSAA